MGFTSEGSCHVPKMEQPEEEQEDNKSITTENRSTRLAHKESLSTKEPQHPAGNGQTLVQDGESQIQGEGGGGWPWREKE